MNSPDARKVLTRAAQIIEKRGWVRGHFSLPGPTNAPSEGPVCAARAIRLAAAELGVDHTPARLLLEPVIGTYSIASWNDRKSKDEVLRVLKEAGA